MEARASNTESAPSVTGKNVSFLKRTLNDRNGEAQLEEKDYFAEASLYYGKRTNRGRALAFRRFERAAEAIRFAIEELSPSILSGCKLEIGEAEYFGQAIRPLYDDLQKTSIAARSR